MKKHTKGLIVFALASVVGVGSAIAGGSAKVIKIGTEMTYKELVKRLNKAVKAEGMLIVTRASASAGAKNRGLSIKGNMVVGVFRNDFALRMLEASTAAGMEAPIRFYITERRDGSGELSYKRPTAVFEPYYATAEAELLPMAKELDVIFYNIAQRATAEN